MLWAVYLGLYYGIEPKSHVANTDFNVLTIKCIHGLAPHYLINDVTMLVDLYGYDIRNVENIDLYI